MKIGLLGGTFDPIHVGHLILAERCREDARLNQVWFMPSYVPPHKQPKGITRFEQRCDMVNLAIVGQPSFRVEPIEKELPPPSYTAHTLAELQMRHPEHTFELIIGGDSLAELPTWYEPHSVVRRARLIAVPRPGVVLPSMDDLATQLGVEVSAIHLQIVDCPLIDIASRRLRADVAAGKSIRYQVPRSIEQYIHERKLYRSEPAS
jgi:nicotinate-nucleotide adenylyltransferase